MSIWKDQAPAKKDGAPPPPEPAVVRDAPAAADFSPAVTAPPGTRPVERPAPQEALKESLIAADLTIEGKIEGTGHIRIAGKFKGDVNVQGDLTIETGAKLNGGVRAKKVTIAGELEGNIESASRVELLSSGVLVGDVKAGALTVAAGSRMRGNAEFGWDEAPAKGGKGNGTEPGTAA
ncbi:polymer-forming cytoskeletal protein [Pseudoxanthomonas sp. PXM02]|jgi:cytoskeletal protein CcmA (bactofilin family)|uniref:bactofilin family protein n=1 Tax=Pseudoxanthomonas sp. PXM02 TaxID=2769294 RepID=UPI00177CA300|nr:polymer-forming cytoskeletal protein [Pseudoxanthomonas sp. PXM02]MBD9477703.1 polymer-forming cytoskeletal protein [Pseudoxanthomonas sp. PXM02]